MKKYENYHKKFNRLAMSFTAFEKKFGVSLPKLSAANEKMARNRFNYLSSLKRRPRLSKIVAAQVVAAQEELEKEPKYSELCGHGADAAECVHCTAAEPQTFVADPSANAAELFASASASHARLDKKAVEEPMTFANVLRIWAQNKTSAQRLERAFLRKRPPLSVQKDDPQSIVNFVESISFPVDSALAGCGHFYDGKVISDDLKVRVNRQMVDLKSTCAADYILQRQVDGKIVFL